MNLITPKQIAIEITSRCNMNCYGCMKTLNRANNQDMDYDFIKSVIDRNTFGATIVPFMNGEPLLHPDIFKIVEYTINKGQRTYITSNMLIWNDDLFELITEENSCYQLVASLDGVPGSHSLGICRPGYKDDVLSNIIRFMILKKKKGNNIDLCLKICQRGQDWEEIENFIYYFLTWGVDYICVGKMLNQSGLPLRRYPCQYFADKFFLIRSDKTIVSCMYNEDVYIKDFFRIGKLNYTEDLLKAYNRPILQKLRTDQENGTFHGPCQRCNSAYTGQGMRGHYEFNDPAKKYIGKVYSTLDYYNQTFSLTDKARGVQFENV